MRAHRALPSFSFAYRLLLALTGLTAGGCGGTKTYPVEGQVVFQDGKPATELAGGMVTFDCPEAKVSAQGSIQADGRFRLGTFRPDDGAVAGEHLVAITPPPPPNPDRPPPPVMRPLKSGLKKTVEPKSNQIEIRVERAKR